MRDLVRRGKLNPLVRQKATEIVSALPNQKGWLAQIRALHKFVRDGIYYVRDINGVETVREAQRVLIDGVGDCDDKAVLLASLLESVGHPAKLVAVGFNPHTFHHVLVETQISKPPREKWLPLETTEQVEAGWYPPNVRARMERHI